MLGRFDEVIEGDARSECAGQRMTQDFWSEIDQRQDCHHARAGDAAALGEGLYVLTGGSQLSVPAIGEADRLDDVLLWLWSRWDSKVVAIGREKESSAVDLFELNVQGEADC